MATSKKRSVPTDGPHIDVLARLRRLQRAVDRGGIGYGFAQDIWQAAAEEIAMLRDRNPANVHDKAGKT